MKNRPRIARASGAGSTVSVDSSSAGRRVFDDCAVAIADADVVVGGVAAGAVADDQIAGNNTVVVDSDAVNALIAADRQRK